MLSGRYQSQFANYFYEARVSAIGPSGYYYLSCDKFSVNNGNSKTYLGSFVAEIPTQNNGIFSGSVTNSINFVGATNGQQVSTTIKKIAGKDNLVLQIGQGNSAANLELPKVSDKLRTLHVVYDMEDGLPTDGPIRSFVAHKNASESFSVPEIFSESLIDLRIIDSGGPSVTGKRGADLVWEMTELAMAYRERKRILEPNFPWAIWLFEVNSFKDDGVFGTLITDLSDPDDQRRGCAIFGDQLDGMTLSERTRNRLRTITHEIGHCFNLIHTDRRSGVQDQSSCFMTPGDSVDSDYWESFDYKFNNDSLMDLHHGFFSDICPGQSPFRDVDHFSKKKVSSLELVAKIDKNITIGEPALLKVTAKNKSKKSILISNSLALQWNQCRIRIDGPTGTQFVNPLFLFCGRPKRMTLGSGKTLSEFVWLHSNSNGNFFSRSGTYKIGVEWQIDAQTVIQAEACFVTVREPLNDLDQLIAEKFYSPEVREIFELMGSDCPTLQSTQLLLEEISERWSDESIAQKCSIVLAQNANREFKSFSKKGLSTRVRKPEVAVRELIKALSPNNSSQNVKDVARKVLKTSSSDEQEQVKAEINSKRKKRTNEKKR